MNQKIIIGVVVVVILIVGVGIYSSGNSTKTNDTMVQKEQMEKEEMEKNEAMKDDVMKDEVVAEGDTMKKMGSYEAYSPEKVARAETGDVVLFFHASWCPSCRGLNSDIESNSSAIPEGLSILKLDYDRETELKKKYGVTTQHTLVQVDKDGNLIKKWSGGGTLNSVVSQLN
jgi:pentapeptide MXKDX repeat protein